MLFSVDYLFLLHKNNLTVVPSIDHVVGQPRMTDTGISSHTNSPTVFAGDCGYKKTSESGGFLN